MESPLRIGVLSVVPSPYQRDLFAAMNARDDLELEVFYLEDSSPDSPWPQKPLASYERILSGRWLALGSTRWHQCERLVGLNIYDFLIVNSYMSSTAQQLMRQISVPWAFWGERMRRQKNPLKAIVRSLLTMPLKHAAFIAAIGTLAKEQYTRKFRNLPVHNIPYYCQLQPFQQKSATPGQRKERLRLLFCGQLIKRKGIDLLLKAFARVAAKNPQVELVLIGREGELNALLETVDNGIQSRIDYRGFKPPEALPEEFARADLFILPSRHDGWGVVVNQALASGLPIICSDMVGAAHDMVIDNQNGRMIPSNNSSALESAILELCNSPSKLAIMGARSKEMSASWSLQSGAAKWAAAIKEAFEKRSIK